MKKYGSFYVIQEGLSDPLWFDRYQDAVTEFKNLVGRHPERKAGVFLSGSTSSLWWHFGDQT